MGVPLEMGRGGNERTGAEGREHGKWRCATHSDSGGLMAAFEVKYKTSLERDESEMD